MDNGEKLLQQFSVTAYQRKRHRINQRINHFVGYGTSNCIVIEGETSLILIDTLDTDCRALQVRHEMESMTGKRVETIIYTHSHPDHCGGSGAYRDSVKEIIAFSSRKPLLKGTERIVDILNQRADKQFGYHLTEEEAISQGIGIREGFIYDEGQRDILPPTTLYHEEMIERIIDGVAVKLVSAVGESDDQLFVWLPDDKVLCCGDTFYACWPNLYAIRGGQYRDIATWIDSLDKLLSYPAAALLPGHTDPLLDPATIRDVLGNFRNAIESILLQTLDCMNQGLTEDETVQRVRLAEAYRTLPYLSEFYGTVNWSVRSIYQGYLGWFDGNPSNLDRLPEKELAQRMISLIGSADNILSEIELAMKREEYQWVVQLCDLLIASDIELHKASKHKKHGLLELAKRATSANARHYYIASAKALN